MPVPCEFLGGMEGEDYCDNEVCPHEMCVGTIHCPWYKARPSIPALCRYAPLNDSFYCQFYRTILCPGNRPNCVRYELDQRPSPKCQVLPEDKAMKYHKFCMKRGIVKACFEFEDGEAVDYLWLSDKEFQLSRVGDCATNYIVP